MFNKLLCVLVLGISFATVSAQQTMTPPCDLTLKDAPQINGFRLGLSKNDFFLVKNDIIAGKPEAIKLKNFGYISNYKALLLEDKVNHYEISFTDGIEYPGVTALAQVVSRQLYLPTKSWQIDQTNAHQATMRCKEFEVSISSIANSIAITDIR
jgi:hypothetical protein